MCNRSLKQTAISLSSCEAEFYADRVCAGENFWESQNSSRNCTTTFQFVSKWIQTRQDTFHSASDQRTRTYRTYRNTMPCNTTVDTRETFVGASSGHEEQHWRYLHETSGWLRTTLAREELGLRILDGTNGTNGTNGRNGDD